MLNESSLTSNSIHHPNGSYAGLICDFPQESAVISVHINCVQNRNGWILLNPSLIRSSSGATFFKCGHDTCCPDEYMVRPRSRRLQQLLESAITYLDAFHPFSLGPVTNFPGYTRATLLSFQETLLKDITG